jgi:ArsR family transcriptional regulator
MIDSTSLELVEGLALGFKALGDPTRLRILATLADGAHCVCEIQEVVDIAPNLLSHHLKVLREAGLIEGSRRGRWIDYGLVPAALRRLQGSLPPDPAAFGLSLVGCADACARDGVAG